MTPESTQLITDLRRSKAIYTALRAAPVELRSDNDTLLTYVCLATGERDEPKIRELVTRWNQFSSCEGAGV